MGQSANNRDASVLTIMETRSAQIRSREVAHGVEPGTYAGFEWLRRAAVSQLGQTTDTWERNSSSLSSSPS